jgi:DNA-binding NarL/FixJ family response regulator
VGVAATIRVLIADDHALVRAGIAALLRGLGDVEIVGEADDGAEAVAMARRFAPDVVLLDISMKGINGLEAAASIVRDSPVCRVIMLSMHTDSAFVQQALAAGASAYLIKGSAIDELELAVRSVMRGEKYLSSALSKSMVEAFLQQGSVRETDRLTQRQLEVLKLIAEGNSTKEIAHVLGVSAKTVESHRATIQQRLGIRDVAGLVRYAMRTRLIPPDA